MLVAGPNARKDYHYNEKRRIVLSVRRLHKNCYSRGVRKEMELHAGDMYLHPANVPHSPVRSAGSIGLVIERKRVGEGFTDGLLWHCDNKPQTVRSKI
jgi:3-hydroxyanthranilate 3,4-dioxygenase